MELVMGQRQEPAFSDIALINKMYCQESCFDRSELLNVTTEDVAGLSRTISGRVCQNWIAQVPHKHGYTYKGDTNDCRNDEPWAGGPWCFTTDKDVQYEPCFSSCENLEAAGIPYCHGYCQNGGYHSLADCKCICPSYASGESCETLDEKKINEFLPCGGKIDLIPGAPVGIHSPNWPAKYSDNTMCMWWVVVPENFNVQMNVTSFDFEEGDETGCYDYLEIRKSLCSDQAQTTFDSRICGNMLDPGDDNYPVSVRSDDQDLIIKFFSDESTVYGGFSAVLHAVPALSDTETTS